MSVRAHREEAGVVGTAPLHRVVVAGCFVSRVSDGDVFQVDIVGSKTDVALKPDRGGQRVWVPFAKFDRDYELVGS